MSVIAEFPYVSIHWQPALATVLVEWRGPATGAGYRAAMEVGLTLLARRGAQRWVADRRRLGRITPDDREWYLQDWLPKARRLGLQQLGVVPADGEVNPMWVNPGGRRAFDAREIDLDGLRVGFFSSVGEALNWAAEQRLMLARAPLGFPANDQLASGPELVARERSA